MPFFSGPPKRSSTYRNFQTILQLIERPQRTSTYGLYTRPHFYTRSIEQCFNLQQTQRDLQNSWILDGFFHPSIHQTAKLVLQKVLISGRPRGYIPSTETQGDRYSTYVHEILVEVLLSAEFLNFRPFGNIRTLNGFLYTKKVL